MGGPQQTQATHAHRTGGRAIAIEITDHHDVLLVCDGLRKQVRGFFQPTQAVGWQQLSQARLCLFQVACTTARIDALQQRRETCGPITDPCNRTPPDIWT